MFLHLSVCKQKKNYTYAKLNCLKWNCFCILKWTLAQTAEAEKYSQCISEEGEESHNECPWYDTK